jgi:hypothetical protein
MKTEQSISTTHVAGAALPPRSPSHFLQLAAARAHRKMRIVLPLPHRPCCVTHRAMLAALREVELDVFRG